MNPLFRIDFSISDSLKIVRKSVLIYETIIDGHRAKKTKRQKTSVSALMYGEHLPLVCPDVGMSTHSISRQPRARTPVFVRYPLTVQPRIY